MVASRMAGFALEIPPVMGLPYLQARRTLLANGWSPRRRTSGDGCGDVLPDRRCSLFPELQVCSHTGLGLCRFEWLSPSGEPVVVITTGGNPEGDPGRVHNCFPDP